MEKILKFKKVTAGVVWDTLNKDAKEEIEDMYDNDERDEGLLHLKNG